MGRTGETEEKKVKGQEGEQEAVEVDSREYALPGLHGRLGEQDLDGGGDEGVNGGGSRRGQSG